MVLASFWLFDAKKTGPGGVCNKSRIASAGPGQTLAKDWSNTPSGKTACLKPRRRRPPHSRTQFDQLFDHFDQVFDQFDQTVSSWQKLVFPCKHDSLLVFLW
jgi:hypothetical protein